MARIKKKGQAGAAKNYITRNQAIRKLQVSLPDFRKLCIWKGIYPREPRSRKKVSKSSTSSTTFYYTKDIQYLLHEPLVQRFRDQKALEKKISKALGRGDVTDAQRLDSNAGRPEKTGKPQYTLDHVIRERYPTFVDALRDLDDCLSMLFLFANLPSTSSVPAKMIARCERLCFEFQHYLIVSRSLTKSFLSIKGIYYQANIQGEDILWLVPYKFNQRIGADVDFRIMATFIEFYMTLLGFVNFRLYTSIGFKYPPKFDLKRDNNAAELGAFTLEGKALADVQEATRQEQLKDAAHRPDPKVQAAVDKVIQTIQPDEGQSNEEPLEVAKDGESEPTETLDTFAPAAAGGDILPQPTSDGSSRGTLFSGCTVFLSRETPRQPLEFLLKAFGCRRVGWDAVLGDGAFTTDELDPRITHQIVDRPPVRAAVSRDGDEVAAEDNQTSQKLAANRRVPGRTYVQPQWVWDSVNDGELKAPHLYAAGASLPPHMSPFVKRVKGAYDPTIPLEEQEPEAEALEAADEEEEEEEEEEDADNFEEGDSVSEGQEDDEASGRKMREKDAEDTAVGAEDNSEEDEAAQRQQELEAELTGAPVKQQGGSAKAKAREQAKKALAKEARQEAEELERAKGMLSKKKRKRFEQMAYSNSKKSAEDQKLREKRRKLEKEKRKGQRREV